MYLLNIRPSLRDIRSEFTSLREQNADLRKKNEALEERIRTLEVRLATTEDSMINLSPENLGNHTHKAFALFSKVPLELRTIVWKLARPVPRVVNIFRAKVDDKDVLYSTAKIPSLLHVCQESRRIAKEWYQLSFPWSSSWNDPYAARVYFDFSADFLYFPSFDYFHSENTARLSPLPWNIYARDTEKVKKVVQEVPKSWDGFSHMSINCPSATEALVVNIGEGMSQGGAELSDFVVTEEAFDWQNNRTLTEIYNKYITSPEVRYKRMIWNLVSIQRVRFCGAVEGKISRMGGEV